MSQTAAPTAAIVLKSPPDRGSRFSFLADMRDQGEVLPVVKEWLRVTRLLVSMFDVMGNDAGQAALQAVPDGVLKDVDVFTGMVAYAKAPPAFFEAVAFEPEPLDLSHFVDLDPEPEVFPTREDLLDIQREAQLTA